MMDYADGVMNGSIVVCESVRNAVKRHLSDLEKSKDPNYPYYFDAEDASFVVDLFPICFKHSIGRYDGLPFILEPWQAFGTACIFGWKRKSDGVRRFRKVYWSTGRKSGKSTWGAAISILLAGFDRNPITQRFESVASVLLSATKRDQADIIYNEIGRMRARSKDIAAISNEVNRRIEFTHNEGTIQSVGSDKPYDGQNPHAVVSDELHAYRDHHRKFYDTMVTGFGSRLQPLHIITTTAGDDQSTLWQEEYSYFKSVVSGEFEDDSVFVWCFELDKDDDPLEESNWIKSNPNLGVSNTIESLREQAAKCRGNRSALNRFVRYYGNRQVTSVEKAFDVRTWDACKGELSDWSTADCVCFAADVGGRDDLASYGAVARWTVGYEEGEDGSDKPKFRYEVKQRSFISSETDRDLETQPWGQWIFEDRITKARWVQSVLTTELIADMEQTNANQVAYDRWDAGLLAEQVEQAGLTPIDFKQTCAMYNEPIREFLDCVTKKNVAHDGDPVLRWAVGNMCIEKNSQDQWKPDKKHSKDKIDPIVAVLMAFRLAMIQPARASGSALIT
jgi:phage terminase large subunit-like protein